MAIAVVVVGIITELEKGYGDHSDYTTLWALVRSQYVVCLQVMTQAVT